MSDAEDAPVVEEVVDVDEATADSSEANCEIVCANPKPTSFWGFKSQDYPPIPPSGNDDETEEDLEVLLKQRECLFLLLEARKLLGSMVQRKIELDEEAWVEKRRQEDEEKRRTGRMSCQEIQEMLQSQPDEDDSDWVSEIQELKKQLVIEIRRNHVLDRDLAKLDKRIALLIKNRTSLQEVLASTRKVGKKGQRISADDFSSDPRKIEHYQDLFYLLQTEPRFLARCVYLVTAEQLDSFMDTTVLTLFGDAFSPREEYLILRLFQIAIQHQISVIGAIGDFLQTDSVIPKMIITYNRRKLGSEYLQKTLSPVLDQVIDADDLVLELEPKTLYKVMINEREVETGEKSTLPRNVTNQEAMENEDVKTILAKRLTDLTKFCTLFLDAILGSLDDLPYGLRFLCKQLKNMCSKAFPDATDRELRNIVVYFVYYRFVNLAIVTPDAYNIVKQDLPALVRKNLIVIAKVLQNLFNFKTFPEEQEWLEPLNDWIEEKAESVTDYFDQLIRVQDPEDHLQVNRYMELTQKSKPVIIISLHEIYQTHTLLSEHLDAIAPDKDDPLRKILQDLGPPPENLDDGDDREIQLTLTNRFKVDVEEDADNVRLYAETKELVIPILRLVPVQQSIQRLHLMDVLEAGIKFATETNNKALSTQINKILENLGKLEAEDMVSKDDNYESFVHDVALEVANRNAIRDQQRREIARLKGTLESLRKHQAYINEQITQYTEYLQDCREKHYQPKGRKKRKKKAGDDKMGPFKFKYKDLASKGVILDSEVPPLSRGKTTFTISSDAPGVFDIVAKIAGVSVEKMQLEFDELLERHYNGVTRMELDQVTLDVNMTIHLINKFFLGAKK
eukprot:TRINITY_DN92_c0_g1_i1.p1 TRINITY_DN92_c0_g1~~TRINITY_DN92_c0_g1_i1.p1  ORF type:complete len:902 (-),score=333.68 TRINITY_DN92_c0_g1_i1:111-2654(-)